MNFAPQSPHGRLRHILWGLLPVWVMIAVVVLCVLLFLFLRSGFGSIVSAPSQSAPPPPLLLGDGANAYDPIDLTRIRRIGSTITVADLHITVTNARPLSQVQGWDAPAAGQQYWAVDVTFENRSPNQPVSVNTYGLWIQAVKARALHYTALTLKPPVDASITALYHRLQPGAVVRATLIHEVPEAADALLWVYYGGESRPASQKIAAFKIK